VVDKKVQKINVNKLRRLEMINFGINSIGIKALRELGGLISTNRSTIRLGFNQDSTNLSSNEKRKKSEYKNI